MIIVTDPTDAASIAAHLAAAWAGQWSPGEPRLTDYDRACYMASAIDGATGSDSFGELVRAARVGVAS